MVGKPLYCSKSCRPTACNWFHHLSSNSLRTQHFIISRNNLHHHHHFHAHITQLHTVSTMWTYVDCWIHAVENQGPTMSPIGLDWIGTHDFEMCALLRLIGCFQTMRVHVRINCKHILIGNLLETASAAFGCGAKSKAELGITSDRLATKIHKSYLSSRSSASAISILRIFYLWCLREPLVDLG